MLCFIIAILINYFDKQTSESRLWPSDTQVMNAILDLPLYRLLTRGRLRIILEAIEDAMRSNKAEDVHPQRGTLTIEHILPQSWQTHWPFVHSVDPEEYSINFAERERVKHTMGNHTLVTTKLNPSLSNSPWEEKKKALSEHSTLFLNKHLLAKWGSEKQFIEPEIRARSLELAKLVCSIWPKII